MTLSILYPEQSLQCIRQSDCGKYCSQRASVLWTLLSFGRVPAGKQHAACKEPASGLTHHYCKIGSGLSDPGGASHWTPICSPRPQRCPLSVPADVYLHTITNKATLQVTIKTLLSVPQGDGSVHRVRGHPTLTQRKAGRLVDICYKDESDAGRRAYGQV